MANAIWDGIVLEHPHDILAFRLAHFLHFYVGDLERMRNSAVRTMARWSAEVPGWGFMLGCHAFALEENGHYGEAEPLGRRAVALNENDIWAGHAIVHAAAAGFAWVCRSWTNRFPADCCSSSVAFSEELRLSLS